MKPTLRFSGYENEWQKLTIDQLYIEVIDGDRGTNYPTKSEFLDEGDCLFLSAKNVTKSGFEFVEKQYITKDKDAALRKGKLLRNDLVLTTRGTVGNIAHFNNSVEEEQIRINSGMVILRNSNPNLSNDFLYKSFYTGAVTRHIQKVLFGSAQPALTVGEIKKFKIGFTGIEEQQKIADFLSSVDKKISLLKEKHALLTQYKKGVMQKLFKQDIRFKDENGNDFPEWQTVPLSKLASKNSKKNKDESVNTVLTNSAKDGIVNQGDYFKKDIANQQNLGGYTVVEKNDFVYNPRISELAPVGPIKRNHIGQGVMSPLYTVFRFKDDSLLDYLELYFNTTMWHRYMHSIANFGARHDRMNITTSDFYALPLPIPSEGERAKIVSFVNALEAKVSAVKQQIELTQTFKKGLLQQMFV